MEIRLSHRPISGSVGLLPAGTLHASNGAVRARTQTGSNLGAAERVVYADTEAAEVAVDSYAGLREFVQARSPALSRTAYLLTGDHQLAEDLLQSALAKVVGRWRRVQAGGNPEGYVRRVLYTEYVTWWRRRRLAERPTDLLPEPTRPDTSEQIVVRLSLEQALQGLTPKQRAVIVLRFYEDRSIEESAVLLGCSTGTVKSQTNYALGRLRKLLPDLSDGSTARQFQLISSEEATA